MIECLANELLLNIVEFLDPACPFASPHPHSTGHPPLKNLSRCSRRLYSLCHPYLFRSLRLELHENQSLSRIHALRSFLSSLPNRRVERIAITFHARWNEGKIGLELKKLLWELQIPSLSLFQPRGARSHREKCAKWAYALEHTRLLRLETMDEDGDLKVLLLRSCPVTQVELFDGKFEREIKYATPELLRSRDASPGLAQLKPAMFPHLRELIYVATWPSLGRFVKLLGFVMGLPALERLEVALMWGVELELKRTDIWFRPTEDGIRYREVVSQYSRLATVVDQMDQLRFLVARDKRNPWVSGEANTPESMVEATKGTYRKINPACDGVHVYL
ncbi:hypothetical protein FN846DRAFT_905240 [Sphaerosporella brunnea]|uniref:F-box domain-containing protein n=1 Tax=Sphaerosporella brunnea TaxID=1250544 RepID=A0A5J5F2G6_9PEZI|nr:hypothetical protein FN846DRAFT_905240 [Sphaerosporella brunnea]